MSTIYNSAYWLCIIVGVVWGRFQLSEATYLRQTKAIYRLVKFKHQQTANGVHTLLTIAVALIVGTQPDIPHSFWSGFGVGVSVANGPSLLGHIRQQDQQKTGEE